MLRYSTEIGLYALLGIDLFLLMYSLQRGIQVRKHPLPLFCYVLGVAIGLGQLKLLINRRTINLQLICLTVFKVNSNVDSL